MKKFCDQVKATDYHFILHYYAYCEYKNTKM